MTILEEPGKAMLQYEEALGQAPHGKSVGSCTAAAIACGVACQQAAHLPNHRGRGGRVLGADVLATQWPDTWGKDYQTNGAHRRTFHMVPIPLGDGGLFGAVWCRFAVCANGADLATVC